MIQNNLVQQTLNMTDLFLFGKEMCFCRLLQGDSGADSGMMVGAVSDGASDGDVVTSTALRLSAWELVRRVKAS